MLEARYRPKLRRLLDELMSGRVSAFADVNMVKISETTGVPRATLYNWLKADVDDETAWFKRYDPETAYRLKKFFSELFERDIEVIERLEIDLSSNEVQETVAATTAA